MYKYSVKWTLYDHWSFTSPSYIRLLWNLCGGIACQLPDRTVSSNIEFNDGHMMNTICFWLNLSSIFVLSCIIMRTIRASVSWAFYLLLTTPINHSLQKSILINSHNEHKNEMWSAKRQIAKLSWSWSGLSGHCVNSRTGLGSGLFEVLSGLSLNRPSSF